MSLGAGQVTMGGVDEGTPIPPPPPTPAPPAPPAPPPVPPTPPTLPPSVPAPTTQGGLMTSIENFMATMDYTMWAIAGVVLFLLKHRRR